MELYGTGGEILPLAGFFLLLFSPTPSSVSPIVPTCGPHIYNPSEDRILLGSLETMASRITDVEKRLGLDEAGITVGISYSLTEGWSSGMEPKSVTA
ncbi:unnamed protein product [Heterotrigona itama]|uniref:Uncharacterized protein n=1 Tax=Heterotrigona itama TaxID=395501 RepID=A0A6V7HBT8_9HYME|nr:unnamed protein product [Heterotrigona itama]